MASQVDICNMALNEVGGKSIASIDPAVDDSKEARLCDENWDILLNQLLGEAEWDFAKKWVELAEVAGYTILDPRYTYVYQIPTDFLRTTRLTDRDTRYVRIEDKLLTNTSSLTIQYVYEITDTTKFPTYFIQALVALLSSKLVVSLAGRGSKKKDWDAIYLYVLAGAVSMDSKESNEDPTYLKTADTWVASGGWGASS